MAATAYMSTASTENCRLDRCPCSILDGATGLACWVGLCAGRAAAARH